MPAGVCFQLREVIKTVKAFLLAEVTDNEKKATMLVEPDHAELEWIKQSHERFDPRLERELLESHS